MTFKKSPIVAALAMSMLSASAVADINVGVIFSLTGPGASLGLETRKSIDLMPRQVNGEKVNFIVLDDGTDPTNSVRNARKLIAENNIDVIFGPNLTSAGAAVADVAAEKQVPLLSQAPIEVAADKHKWSFRVEPVADIMVGKIVEDMKSKGVKTVGFIGFSDNWGELVLKAMNNKLSGTGITVTGVEKYARSDSSVTAQILKLQSAKPDAVLIGATGTPAVLPHATLKERGFKGPIYQTHAVANKEFLRVGGRNVEGGLVAVAPVLVADQLPDSHPNKASAMAFIKDFEQKYGAGSRSTFAGASWDGWQILEPALAAALKKGKPGSQEFRNNLRDALEKTKNVVGVNGSYTMSAKDHGGYAPSSAVLVEVSNGQWKFVK